MVKHRTVLQNRDDYRYDKQTKTWAAKADGKIIKTYKHISLGNKK